MPLSGAKGASAASAAPGSILPAAPGIVTVAGGVDEPQATETAPTPSDSTAASGSRQRGLTTWPPCACRASPFSS